MLKSRYNLSSDFKKLKWLSLIAQYYQTRFRTPYEIGRPLSAAKRSFLLIAGPCVEQKKGTLYTVPEKSPLRSDAISMDSHRAENNINNDMKTDGSDKFPDGGLDIARSLRRKDLSRN